MGWGGQREGGGGLPPRTTRPQETGAAPPTSPAGLVGGGERTGRQGPGPGPAERWKRGLWEVGLCSEPHFRRRADETSRNHAECTPPDDSYAEERRKNRPAHVYVFAQEW